MSERLRETEIEQLRAELQAARAALGEFAYVVSHDLRAPLRHILAYSQLLREELGDRLAAEPAQFLDTLTQAAQLMGRQIDGLKEWSQLDRVDLQRTTVDSAGRAS
jgi:light-regulated signal transduction histidine kinase (bacteriophytochrome)